MDSCIRVSTLRIKKKYLFIGERENKGESTSEQGEGDADSPISRDPNMRLDVRTPGLGPEPKVDT